MNTEENYMTYAFCIIVSLVSLYAWKNKRAFDRLLLHPASVIYKREYYRIITSALVHNDFLHLGVNLFMIYVFCSGLEESTPVQGFGMLAIAGSSLLGGHLLTLFLHRKDIKYSCTGASGIVMGFLCSFMIFHPFENHFSFPFIGDIPNIYPAVLYLMLTLLNSKKGGAGKVDYGIHVGGGISGSLITILLYPTVFTL